jgi:hypothetical protein
METAAPTAALATLDDAAIFGGECRRAPYPGIPLQLSGWGRPGDATQPISGVTPALSPMFPVATGLLQASGTGPAFLSIWSPTAAVSKAPDVDYDIRPVTFATAVRAVDTAAQVCQEIQQRSGGLAP